MVTETFNHPDYIVTRDGNSRSVWVNGPVNCLGRFTPVGFEINRAMKEGEEQPDSNSSITIEVKMKNLNSVDWGSFKTLMKTHHNIDLSEVENPLIEISKK